ncbi:MAG: 1-aminocyclopropane-1-carboxylate deaminase/D-cysteine desulfhydrase [Methylomonas sp.]
MKLPLHPHLQALERHLAPAPLMQILDAELNRRQLELWIKRDDLIHPVISGNKWRKLKFILNHALHLGADTIVSMGGAYSNHLHALAFIGKLIGIKTVGFVRGERPEQLTPTLIDLQDWGMELRFVSRSEYRQLREYKDHDSLPGLKPGEYWLPEGGATELALQGVGESLAEIDMAFDVLAVACGTGTTLAGLIAHSPLSSRILGVAALKNAGFLVYDVQQLLESRNISRTDWQIALDYHCGGFAQTTPALLAFIREFQERHGVPLEPVYTGKLLFAVYDLIRLGHFQAGQRLVVLHTGGLQGKR